MVHMKHVVICEYTGLEYTAYQGLQFNEAFI